jgi:DNA (cytosine-5)-methyltransferase 1
MHHKFTVLDLFSGIGGFSLGLESTGYFETIAFVEKNQFCQKVLAKNFKDIPIEGDIRNVKGQRYEADVVTGGFPCQPFSTAGKRKGTDDDRYLWDETIRVIRECKPRWFIGENVEGIINIQDGMVLRQVQDDLEEEGFEVRCLIIPASGKGAWHQRKRVWIIANTQRKGLERHSKYSSTINRQKQRIQSRSTNSTGHKNVSNSKSIRHRRWDSKRRANKKWSFFSREQEGRKMGSKTSRCSSKKQETWWQTESRVCGIPDGVSYELDKDRSQRVKALGNSIVPQIVYEIGKAIIEGETSASA